MTGLKIINKYLKFPLLAKNSADIKNDTKIQIALTIANFYVYIYPKTGELPDRNYRVRNLEFWLPQSHQADNRAHDEQRR